MIVACSKQVVGKITERNRDYVKAVCLFSRTLFVLLVGEQAAAFTGGSVGMQMEWRNTYSGKKKKYQEIDKL